MVDRHVVELKISGFLESPSYSVIAKARFSPSTYTANLFPPFILQQMR